MRIFVAGNRGLVGEALMPLLAEAGMSGLGEDLPDLDVREEAAVRRRIERIRSAPGWDGCAPDWIVNLAAATDVDGCERGEPTPDAPWRANADGAENLARAAARFGCRMLQVSTDYVFDGRSAEPYGEESAVNPLSVYGKSKLEGERRIPRHLREDSFLVVRGQSLYGKGRKSFPDAILRAAETKAEIPVVVDQVIQPTWAREFAAALVALLRADARGTFHYAAAGCCTWNAFARAVLEEAGVTSARITETTAAALGRPAPRPANSVFDLAKYAGLTGTAPRPWREQLRDYLRSTGRAA